MIHNTVFRLLSEERERQFEKWGHQNHSASMWMLILVEEIGEICAALLQGTGNAKAELIQAGAVIIAWLEVME